ncbi:MAG: hypothetical protein QM777_12125 [Pseudorhodoferax sp.]
MVTVDLTPVPQAALGSEVTLWGRAGNGTVLPDGRGGLRCRHRGLRADVRGGAARARGRRGRLKGPPPLDFEGRVEIPSPSRGAPGGLAEPVPRLRWHQAATARLGGLAFTRS